MLSTGLGGSGGRGDRALVGVVVSAGDAGHDAADDFVAVGAGESGEFGGGGVWADEFGGVAGFDVGKVGGVDHHLIHADQSDDGASVAV